MTVSNTDRAAVPESLNEAQVEAWLRAHPDFLTRNPALLEVMTSPARKLGDGVADLQQAIIRQLRGQVSETEDMARLLIEQSRDNLAAQAQIHESVLHLLEASSLKEMVETLATDLAAILDLDVITLCIEREPEASALDRPLRTEGLRLVGPGTVDQLFGPDRIVLLRSRVAGTPALFGSIAPVVKSDALVRLDLRSKAPPALLAFGSHNPDWFHPDQATELLEFLGRATAALVRLRLAPSDAWEA